MAQLLRAVQTLCSDLLLAVREGQPVLRLKLLADAHVAQGLFSVRGQRRVVTNPIIEDMQVGMLRSGVAYDEVLRIGNLHALHILLRQVEHQLVRHPRGIAGWNDSELCPMTRSTSGWARR